MAGLQTAEAMLTAAQADFDVALTKVIAVDDELNPFAIPTVVPYSSQIAVRQFG